MYEQLQDILNKCIEKWWKPFGIVKEYKFSFKYNWNSDYILMKELIGKDKFFCREYKFSTNDLFSKDSWLLERFEWGNNEDVGMFYLSLKPSRRVKYSDCIYMVMWPMNEKEKIEYFIENVTI